MRSISCFIAALWLTVAPGAAQTIEEVLARLERAESDVQRLRFDFSQTTRIALTGEAVTARGTAFFERPNLFRIEQRTPTPQTVVGDGKDLWFYLPQRGQVIHDALDRWAESAGFPKGLTPFRFNVSEMREKYKFTLESTDPRTPVVTLTPSGSETLPYTVRLWVDLKTGVARRTELSSPSVTATTEIKNLQINLPLPRDTFLFRPPKDSDVLEMPSLKKELP